MKVYNISSLTSEHQLLLNKPSGVKSQGKPSKAKTHYLLAENWAESINACGEESSDLLEGETSLCEAGTVLETDN